MHSKNFIFWKTAFERKQVDIYTLAQMVSVNGELTSDEFQEITGMNYIPDTSTNKVNFVSTADIVKELAATKIANIQKDNQIKVLSKQVMENKLISIQKDNQIKIMMQTIMENKLQLMKLGNK
ncbi:hypothetical protein [Clostridium thermobutyricum]|uniref:hypothetical protein n=1 Tax=Clostridium thermobutyricum TaxID=29372 RepID=UPI003F51F33C